MEDIDGAIGIRATIDASDVQKSANDFIKAIQNMANESDKVVNTMADGYGFLMEQISKLSEAIDAAKGKLTAISGSMANVAPKDSGSVQAYEDLKAQVDALTQVNDSLKAKLNETTANIAAQAKAADTATGSMREFDSASQSMGNNNIASASAKTKGEIKELADGIAFLTEQTALASKEYEQLAQRLDELQQKKQNISKSNIPTESFADSKTGEVQVTSKDTAMASVNTEIDQTQAKMTTLRDIIAQNRDEIANCSQRMNELGNQTSQTSSKSVTLRTELRNARQHVAEMILSGQQNTVEFGKAVNEANKLQAAFNKASMAISGKNLAFNSFNMLSTSINGVTGALSTYMGIAGLFTSDQEKLTEVQKNLQSVMSISMGVQQLMSAATQISVKWDTLKASALAAVTASTESATVAEGGKAVADEVGTATAITATAANWTLATAIKAVSAAIKQIPVLGWIIAAVAALVAGAVALYNWITKLTPEQEAARDAAKAYGEQIKKNNETMLGQSKQVAENVVKYKQLQNKYNEVKNDSKKLDAFIKDNKQSFEDLGFSINDATEAENMLHKNSDKVVESFRLRARAAAQAQVAMDSYARAYKLQLEAEGWINSAKYGHMRHNEDDRRTAIAKGQAMLRESKRMTSVGDRAMSDSNKTTAQLNAHNQKYGIAVTKTEGKTTKHTNRGHGGGSTNEKSQAQIDYENLKKWSELFLSESNAYHDKLKEFYQASFDIKEDGSKKSLLLVEKQRHEQRKALVDWLNELADKRRDVSKEVWINSKEGRNEFQWSQTAQGKMSREEWVTELTKKNPDIDSVFTQMMDMVDKKADSDRNKVIDDVIKDYNSKQESRLSAMKKLKNDIEVLEEQLNQIEDKSQKQRTKNAINNAREQLAWVEQSKGAWNEYYQKYGTFLEKRAALEEKFLHDTQGLDKNSPEYKAKYEEYKQNKSSLSTSELKSNIDWSSVFSDIGMMSSKMAKIQLANLQAYTQTDEYKGLEANDKQAISEAIDKLEKEAGSQIIGSFKKFGKAVDAYRKQLVTLSVLQDNEIKAQNALIEAKNVEAQKTQELADAQEKLKQATESGKDADIQAAQKNLEAAQKNLKSAQENYATAKKNADDSSNAVRTQTDITKQSRDDVRKHGKNLTSSFDTITSVFQNLKSGSLSGTFNSIVSLVDAFKHVKEASNKTAKQQEKDAKSNSESAKQTKDSQDDASKALNATSAALQAVPEKWSQIVSAALSVLDILGDDLEGGIGNLAGALLERVGNIIETLLSQIGSGKFFADLGKGVWNLVAGLWRGFGDAFGIRDNWNSYRKASEQYEKLDKVWNSLISKKKEYLSLSYGDEAKKVGEEYIELAKTDLKATKLIAKQFLGAWKKGSHSAGYKFNEKMKGSVEGVTWSDVSRTVGTSITDVSQLADLSKQQLESLKENYTEWWVKLPEKYQEYLDSIIDKQDTLDDATQDVLEKLTGVKFDNMYSNFMSALTDMSKSADDWVSDFKDKIRSAIIENMMGEKVKSWMKDYTERYQAAMKAGNGIISEAQKQQFIDEAKEMSNQFYEERKQITENVGLGKSSIESTKSSGYATASEESIEELSGRALATNEALYSIRNQQLIDAATLVSINDGLQVIVTIENKRNDYYAESIEIQRTSVSHLAAIEKNTNELYTMNAKLTKIEKNTRNM